MAGLVGHRIDGDQVVLLNVIVEFRAGIGVGDGNLDGLVVQPLGEIDGLADALAGLAGQADDEIAVHQQAQLLAVGGEAFRHVDRGALLDVLQDLLVARLIAHNQQPATGFFHSLESVVIGSNARRAAPGEVCLLYTSRCV